ncbi:MAG: hypothetical protein KAR35_03200 [Candidatus Heimdallarchaeota archaeon]|nr:hypothetical protein [Candidatus Heimdallarchaeota archaeon]MCK5048363.1 hypothetical protein [Candidatus Heimdallarchaeota archaeon]
MSVSSPPPSNSKNNSNQINQDLSGNEIIAKLMKEQTFGFNDYLKVISHGIIFATLITLFNLIIVYTAYWLYSYNWFLLLDFFLLLQAAMFFIMGGIIGAFGPSISLRLAFNTIFKTTLDKPQSFDYMISMIRYVSTAMWLIVMAYFAGWLVRL